MGSIMHLDLDVIVIKGFERRRLGNSAEFLPAVSDRIVEEVIKGIHAGAKFDPVIIELDYEDHETYKLSFVYNETKGFWEGGHIRTIAHFIEGVPLRCRMVTEKDFIGYPATMPKLTPISQYLILDDSLFAEKGIGLERRREIWQEEKIKS